MAANTLFSSFILLVTMIFVQIASSAQANIEHSLMAPNATFFATVHLQIQDFIMVGRGPLGIRIIASLAGGNITGPNLEGMFIRESVIVLPGGDWLLQDPASNVYTIDARYEIRTTDGESIYVTGSGFSADLNLTSGQLPSKLYERNIFETGSKKYYWLNNIMTMGVVTLTDGNVVTTQVWQIGWPTL
ncbi:hypothetical protein OIDMADRAFT_32773 [Oidiodendron maius Zn]|uniref:Uncharacterized protein n=1 Tax=Oidiodendron maius (strain Zn) TaxID=913774 RepID=A0A0C3H0E9_OIDMZ|nr:hypothetical protein OIDMADRAFT_32773 [Oidiodendron maius Zn]